MRWAWQYGGRGAVNGRSLSPYAQEEDEARSAGRWSFPALVDLGDADGVEKNGSRRSLVGMKQEQRRGTQRRVNAGKAQSTAMHAAAA